MKKKITKKLKRRKQRIQYRLRNINWKNGFSRGINWGVDTAYRSKRGKELEKYTKGKSARHRYIVRFECDLLMDEK